MSFIIDEINNDLEYIDNTNTESDQIYSSKYDNVIIGIDLGTTNSCVGIWRNNNLEIIPDKYGNKTIPSVVAFTNNDRYIGLEAKKQIELNPDNTFYEIKRLIGRKYDDIYIQNDKSFFTYDIINDNDNNIHLVTKLNNKKKRYTPEEISAMILSELKNMAESYLKHPIKKVVVTIPAYFNDSQREATRDACIIAGLECVRIINEPTSAALAYGLEKLSLNKETDINVLVYDLGGGTLDCSILNISNGIFEVLGSTGNMHLGGADFDNRLINHCINHFKKKYNLNNFECDNFSMQRLKNACEEAKKLLSTKVKTVININDFYDNKKMIISITREDLTNICKDLFILCLKPVEDVLNLCEMNKKDIDEIILVGGCTRMIQIRENLRLFFDGKIPNSSVNPDEVVAAGASIQGYIIRNKSDPFSESVVLLDIVPLSLGIETIGGIMTDIISRNSVIPITRKKKFTTITDYETSVIIKIYEGERKMTQDNFFVGEFELSGLESAPRGIVQIEVCFSIDVNGIISVSAYDLKNDDVKQTITITGNKGRLSQEKINELIEEAQNMELIDKVKREKKQYLYEIDELCSNIKFNIGNEEFKLKQSDKDYILQDIQKIYDFIIEKKKSIKSEYDIKKKELLDILNKLKKKYGTLILKCNSDNTNNIKSIGDSKNNGTTIFGKDDDIDEIDDNEHIDDHKSDDSDTDDKYELKKIHNELIELCYHVFEIINNNIINISEEDKSELKNYINDVLLWIHVKEKITKIEYIQKIQEINNLCDNIAEKYEFNDIINNKKQNSLNVDKDELEQLCYALKNSIMANLFSFDENNIKKLNNLIDDTLKWIVDIDISNEISNNICEDENMYRQKINIINDFCTQLYNNMININIYNDVNNIDIVTDDCGTSIKNLKNKYI